MTGFRKATTAPASRRVLAVLEGVSKYALTDIVLDAIALANGTEIDELTVGEIADFCDSRLLLRGDATIGVLAERLDRRLTKRRAGRVADADAEATANELVGEPVESATSRAFGGVS